MFFAFNYRSLPPSLILSLFLAICTYAIYSICKLQISLFENLSRAEGFYDRTLLYEPP